MKTHEQLDYDYDAFQLSFSTYCYKKNKLSLHDKK